MIVTLIKGNCTYGNVICWSSPHLGAGVCGRGKDDDDGLFSMVKPPAWAPAQEPRRSSTTYSTPTHFNHVAQPLSLIARSLS